MLTRDNCYERQNSQTRNSKKLSGNVYKNFMRNAFRGSRGSARAACAITILYAMREQRARA